MSINQIINYVPQSAIQQMNKFVNILSSVDKKTYFFATAIAGLSVLLVSHEIKSRKLEKKVVELTELRDNYCNQLNNLILKKEHDDVLNKENNLKLQKDNKCLFESNQVLVKANKSFADDNYKLKNELNELLLTNSVMKKSREELFDQVQSIKKGMQIVTDNQSYIYNQINVELQGLSQRQDERHNEVLENIMEVKESQTHWSHTINDRIHNQVINAGTMLERAGSSSKAYLSRAWSWFGQATEGMSLNL